MILVFGGSFDPIHQGHLDLARRAIERYKPRKLYLVPAKKNPLKDLGPGASADERLTMVQIAASVLARPEVEVVDWEIRRDGPSFTWDTLEVVRHLNNDPQVALVVGDEVFQAFHQWHRAGDILKTVDIVVCSRNEAHSRLLLERTMTLCGISDGKWEKSPHAGEARFVHTRGRRWLETFSFEALPVSGSEIREILAIYRGSVRPPAIPDPVWEQIKKIRLYSVK